ncbi:hypothetical protein [Acinetobacter sp.]
MSSMVAPIGKVRVWLGIRTLTKLTKEQSIQWSIDGMAVKPNNWSTPLTNVDYKDLCDSPFYYTGIYEFDVHHIFYKNIISITLRIGESEKNIKTRQIPDSIEKCDNNKISILLTSCYSRLDDKDNKNIEELLKILKNIKIDMTIMMGDQVYLDDIGWIRKIGEYFQKSKENIKDRVLFRKVFRPLGYLEDTIKRKYYKKLMSDFLFNYWENWKDKSNGFGEILQLAPWVSIPDDHEYWNNYPMRAFTSVDSILNFSKEIYQECAQQCFKKFQTANYDFNQNSFQVGDSFYFKIDPISFFLADTRSCRQNFDNRFAMSNRAWNGFNNWKLSLSKNDYPVIVTGQSLLETGISIIKEHIFDANLADFNDYILWLNGIAEITNDTRGMLLLTGDVHYPSIRKGIYKQKKIFEIISSPLCLVQRYTGHREASYLPKTIDLKGDKISFELLLKEVDDIRKGDHVTLLEISLENNDIFLQITRFLLNENGYKIAFPKRLLKKIKLT